MYFLYECLLKNKGHFQAKSGQDDLRATVKLNPEKLESGRKKKSRDALVTLKLLLLQIVRTGRNLPDDLVQPLLIGEETKALRREAFPVVATSPLPLPTTPITTFFLSSYKNERRLPPRLSGKESACNARDVGSIPGSEGTPWRRKWQPAPVFLSGNPCGQRSPAGYSPWGHTELRHGATNNNNEKF